jgi:DNA-binding NarL/FixJ family response regulator
MRRGFKAESERQATSLRSAIGCSETRTPDLADLATHLRVAVLPADRLLNGGIQTLLQLHDAQPGCFSAATISPPGGRHIVIYNPVSLDGQILNTVEARADGRTRSNVAHEFAHIVLGHDIRQVQKISGQHFFTCNPDQEEEANWLAGALLLPRPLLLNATRDGLTNEEIARRNEVSVDMARFRTNATGVKMQVARTRRTPRS